MKSSSTYRVLFLLNLLNRKDYTKNEIIEEFSKIGERVTKPSINSYINKLLDNGFNIEVLNKKNENLYHLAQKKKFIEIEEGEFRALDDIKKILVAQKDYNKIRKFIRILYKTVLHIKDPVQAQRFFDFGYYSKINWWLVRQLENHCKNKDLIEIDYVLPSGQNRKLTVEASEIKISDWSDRLYLWCMFENSTQLSYLPIDRIFMINKVKEKRFAPKNTTDKITYAISKDLFEEIILDEGEKLTKSTKDYVFIERELKDEFYLIQRLMSFCPNLYYVSNQKIKNTVKEKLQQLKLAYGKEYD